ncbi:MAG: transcriptional repressor, partial [Eubacteriales bacterium]|nr:transcriptional repressor [Eubacteriales bacterium]
YITVQQIAKHLQDLNTPVGTTTIYRYLETLVSEGLVKKYVLDGISGACFQYVEEDEFENIHFHFKCNNCGELIHFECEELQKLYTHLLNEHQMNIDLCKTIYYGTCKTCSKI